MKTLVIESIPLLLQAITQLLSEFGEVSSLPNNLQNKIEKIDEIQPDLIWLDASLPEVQDCSLLKIIRKKTPNAKILLFGSDETIPEVRKFFKIGICAYLPKTLDVAEINTALSNVVEGNIYVPASMNKIFASWLTDPVRKKKPGTKLSLREQEVLQLIVEEYTSIEIAKKLFISKCTVETHRINLIEKLGVKNVAGLVRVAFEAGYYKVQIA
jgi:DNA-binding NarL/FixJ family response regulator